MNRNPLKEQVGGDHYMRMKIQPIEFTELNKLGFSIGCIVKYISRHRVKNGAEDIRKVIQYADFIALYNVPTPEDRVMSIASYICQNNITGLDKDVLVELFRNPLNSKQMSKNIIKICKTILKEEYNEY